MNAPKVAVRRPVATAMLFVAILLFGIVSLKMLPLDIMPELEMPNLTVITVYPGASAEEVEQQITEQLEEILASTEGLKSIKSSSRENVSFVSLQFEWGEDITEASNNVRDLIEPVKNKLPDDARSPVIFKVNTSMMPVLIYGITAEENYYGMEKIIENKISNKLRKIEGVGNVIGIGAPTREIHIEVIPERLKAYGLSIQQIGTVLQAENLTIPGGYLKVGDFDYALKIPGEFSTTEEIGSIPLINFNDRIIRLCDVAKVIDTYKDKDEYARTKNGLGIAYMVQKQSGANTLNVIEQVRDEIEVIQRDLPKDIEIFEIITSDELIVEALGTLTGTLFWAMLFVTLVVFAFLREWKGSFIVFLSIPFSLIFAFIVMFIMGYTINIISLMSLVIAIGMVVDNSIVVLENISRHIENGSRPKQAAIFGSGEMGMAITASTATTLMVFLPMIFMGGVVGIMFKQLAVLTSITLLGSLFTALTLTPMASSRLLKAKSERKKGHSKLYQFSEKMLMSIENVYKRLLGWAVYHKSLTLIFAIVLLVVSLWLGKDLGSDYIPEFDAGDVACVIKTEKGSSAEETDRVAQKVLKIFEEEIPEMIPGTLAAISGQTEDGILSSVGFDEGKNTATILCHLSKPDERERSSKEIGEIIRQRLEEIPELVEFRVSAGSLLSSAITGNEKPVEIKVFGNEFDQINSSANAIFDTLSSLDWLSDVQSTVDDGKMEVHVNIDKQKASSLGLNTAMIAMQVRQSIYGMEAGEFSEKGEEYDILIQYAAEARNRMENLGELQLTTLRGTQVPLKMLADIVQGMGPTEIKRETQQRNVVVKADLKEISLGEAADRVQGIIENMSFPEEIDVVLQGQVESQGDSFSDLNLILFLGILLVYMVMSAQFESFKDPFIIMFSIPFALIGVIWAFKLTGLTLSITTFIGLIMLMGIVVNNGIVLVDYTNLLRKRGYNLRNAVMEAGRSRMRPVLMTSLTTMLGMLPMALSQGMGKEMFSPLGVTMIGGLFVSTFITLLLIPTIYTVFNIRVLNKERKLSNTKNI